MRLVRGVFVAPPVILFALLLMVDPLRAQNVCVRANNCRVNVKDRKSGILSDCTPFCLYVGIDFDKYGKRMKFVFGVGRTRRYLLLFFFPICNSSHVRQTMKRREERGERSGAERRQKMELFEIEMCSGHFNGDGLH
uniref:Uncharacterized protein n=1 Tax=Strigamia maritima TaxID=126957 RepID=T1JLP1_STRMM